MLAVEDIVDLQSDESPVLDSQTRLGDGETINISFINIRLFDVLIGERTVNKEKMKMKQGVLFLPLTR